MRLKKRLTSPPHPQHQVHPAPLHLLTQSPPSLRAFTVNTSLSPSYYTAKASVTQRRKRYFKHHKNPLTMFGCTVSVICETGGAGESGGGGGCTCMWGYSYDRN